VAIDTDDDADALMACRLACCSGGWAAMRAEVLLPCDTAGRNEFAEMKVTGQLTLITKGLCGGECARGQGGDDGSMVVAVGQMVAVMDEGDDEDEDEDDDEECDMGAGTTRR